MNETTPSTTTTTDGTAKRVRRRYDAAFKQSAVADRQRHSVASTPYLARPAAR